MYLFPKNHRCQKCGFECKYGEHDPFPAPVLSEGPVCPQCYANFLREHCGVMVSVDHPRKDEPEKRAGAWTQTSYS